MYRCLELAVGLGHVAIDLGFFARVRFDGQQRGVCFASPIGIEHNIFVHLARFLGIDKIAKLKEVAAVAKDLNRRGVTDNDVQGILTDA